MDLLVYARRDRLPSIAALQRHLRDRGSELSLEALPAFGESAGFVPIGPTGFELSVGPVTPADVRDYLDDLEASGEEDVEGFGRALADSDVLLSFASRNEDGDVVARQVADGIARLSGGTLVDPQTGVTQTFGRVE